MCQPFGDVGCIHVNLIKPLDSKFNCVKSSCYLEKPYPLILELLYGTGVDT